MSEAKDNRPGEISMVQIDAPRGHHVLMSGGDSPLVGITHGTEATQTHQFVEALAKLMDEYDITKVDVAWTRPSKP